MPTNNTQTAYRIGQDNIRFLGLDIHNPVFVVASLTIVGFVAGVPAKIMREITDEEAGWMVDANADYHSARERAWASMERVDALHRLDRKGPRLSFAGSEPLYKARGG